MKKEKLLLLFNCKEKVLFNFNFTKICLGKSQLTHTIKYMEGQKVIVILPLTFSIKMRLFIFFLGLCDQHK